MKVGFIGLGDMGGAMAARIAKGGHQLHVWARRPESLTQLAGMDVVVHDTPAGLAREVEHLGICVVAESDVRSVLIDSGALAALPANSLVAVHATLSPQAVIRLAAEAGQCGHALIDAPVSGAREGAEAGSLSLMIGAAPGDLERARPVLDTYAGQVWHVGDVGAGQTVKILNNLAMNANITIAQLVLELGERLGVERAALREIILRGSGASRGLEALDRIIHRGSWSPINGRKDLALARDLLKPAYRGEALLDQVIAVAAEVREDMAPGSTLLG